MSTKNYYQNQIDSIKTDIGKLKAEIASKNARIKEYQKEKSEVRAYYQRQIASASSSSTKASYRSSLSAKLGSIDSYIASLRNQIDDIKRQVAAKQTSLQQAQANKKNAKK
jgi:SMC interacting uncharacterized protein involved in chromosome segregation